MVERCFYTCRSEWPPSWSSQPYKAVLRMLLGWSGLALKSFPSLFSNFSTTLKPPQVNKMSGSPQLVPSAPSAFTPWAFLV